MKNQSVETISEKDVIESKGITKVTMGNGDVRYYLYIYPISGLIASKSSKVYITPVETGGPDYLLFASYETEENCWHSPSIEEAKGLLDKAVSYFINLKKKKISQTAIEKEDIKL